MAQTVSVIVSAEDRARLAAIIGDRSWPLKHIQRAKIVLFSADQAPASEVARRAGVSRPAVWRWQHHYGEGGVERLLREGSRKPGKPRTALSVVAKVVALTCFEPPGELTHWTGRAMAEASGLSLRTVQRIWEAHNLQPHRLRTVKRSKDPAFAEKVEDIVGLYMHPPAHAVVLSIDEKSQIQALDPTQPGLPIKPGKCGTMTHDYKRHGTTTLFAAFNILDGVVLGRCMQKHTHQEFIRFLNTVENQVPANRQVHVVLDNYATHKHPKVVEWLGRHDRFTFHFTPTSASWINAVEGFFAKLTNRRLKRGVFHSIVALQAAINRFVKEANQNPKPFRWTKDPDKIIAAVRRGHQALDSYH